MTDDELEQRLRRLDARPEREPAFWDDMTAAVRTGYAQEEARRARGAITRRRRLATSGGAILAMAAALALWLRVHHHARPAHEPMGDTFHVFEDLEPGELLEELSPADVDRVAKAFNKGA